MASAPPQQDRPISLRARWLFPLDRPPIADGVVTIRGGRIQSLGQQRGEPITDLGDVALLPGLINAHTHLEFSYLHHPLGKPRTEFSSWIRRVMAERQQRRAAGTAADDIRLGIDAAAAGGAVAVGEIASEPWFTRVAPPPDLHCLVFYERLGLHPDQIDHTLEQARSLLAGGAQFPGITLGLSPHAPYSTHPELVRALVELAREFNAPVAMHLAETDQELQLLADHSGPFRQLLDDLNVWQADQIRRGSRPLDYLKLLKRAPRSLIVHGNYLQPDEWDTIAGCSNMSVVYCPRTHSYFGHRTYPLSHLLARNINVCLGTDSLASNPDLSVWRELIAAATLHPEVAPQRLIAMGTINGAIALGLADQLGTISPGKSAALVQVPLGSPSGDDPYDMLLAEDIAQVQRVAVNSDPAVE